MSGKVYAIGTDLAGQFNIAVDEHLRAMRMGNRDYLCGESKNFIARQKFFADLNQLQARRQHLLQPVQVRCNAHFTSVGDGVNTRQRQRFENRHATRQYRRDGKRIQPLPHKLLALHPAHLAVPRTHAPAMQPHRGVGVNHHEREPGRGFGDGDVQLFHQFAFHRLQHRLARLDFATGKFPIAGIRFAFGA